ncbi:MraY family glycosyltransferase [Amaricoccus solimangrovi]|uniref:MraY family glycosyltransferase n=1 Tax=Amaricoccus solimangrovi TaxID=2589815 RepID=UPI0015E32B00|nr:glycosyltransferase [Amaricoccus solimangrovi]
MTEIGWEAIDGAAFAAFVLSLVLCLAFVVTQRWHGRFTHDHMNGPQKFHKTAVPRIGGLALALSYAAVTPLLQPELRALWILVGLAGLPALLAGLAEDVTRRVGVKWRLGATMGAGVIFALLTGYVMDKVDLPGVDWLLGFYAIALLFTGFSMGGVANAVNIIDGFNGLAAGTLLILFGTFAWVAHQVGDDLVFQLALLFAAVVLGFFCVNFPLGKIFLGDGGAYFCGYLLAVLGVLLPARNPEVSAWTAILICAYPVIETLSSMSRKSRREGHSVGQPDRVHFHMLAYRHYARRIVRAKRASHLRNPATSLVTWTLPVLTTLLVMASYRNPALSAAFFFLTAYIYGQLYRVMSLNAAHLPLRLARLL